MEVGKYKPHEVPAMPEAAQATETVLIVDDEEPVRQTFREWLDQANLGCRVLTAADAEAALVLANKQSIDLAILDWNLGAGNDGLQLLEDLSLFNPDIVAILVTGYAHQATPLDALRMGVRDYFDKNQDLTRESFVSAVGRQLDRIRPVKRERKLHQELAAFRAAVEKVLPLVQSSAALTDPVPFPSAVASLFRFLVSATGARDGVLLVRHYDPARQPAEWCRAFGVDGQALSGELVPFSRSLAATVVSLQEPYATDRLENTGGVELQPFERGRRTLLAAPLAVNPGTHVVLELFDKAGDFTAEDRGLVTAGAEFAAEMLRHATGEQQTQQVLFDAVAAALRASESVEESLRHEPSVRLDEPPPAAVIEQLRQSLGSNPQSGVAAKETLRLAEAVRVLALRHGPAAVGHCIQLVESLRGLLDSVTCVGEAGRE
jgi:ActR/RegA family two-component response regulator